MSSDLSALVARLEAVTTRLEAAADKTGGGAPQGIKVLKFIRKVVKAIDVRFCRRIG